MKKIKFKHYIFYITTICYIFFSTSGSATQYFISASGSDSNPGTSEDLPWQSLERVNKVYKFEPGDQILFKRGDSWEGTLVINASGTADNPVIYGAYGVGEKPVIYGSETITGWTKYSENIYQAKVISEVKQVFINNIPAKAARYPNSGWFFPTSVTDNSNFSCSNLNSKIDYSGAIMMSRNYRYRYSCQTVASSSETNVTLSSDMSDRLSTSTGFWLTNKLEFLDQAGEWFYDTSTNILYLWTPNGNTPENYNIRATLRDNNIYMNSKNNVIIKNIKLLHAGDISIYQTNSNNTTYTGCDIEYPYRNGIYVGIGNNSHTTFINNTIRNTGDSGLRLWSSNSVISGNTFEKIGLIDLISPNVGTIVSPVGISVHNGDDVVITDNIVKRVAYNGINFFGTNTLVEYNYVDSTNLLLDDGGGIYTYQGTQGVAGSQYSVIRNNIITNIFGAPYKGSTNYYGIAGGIVLDGYSHDITIENNTIAHINCGFFPANGDSNIFKNNTVMDFALGVNISYNLTSATQIKNNIICTDSINRSYTWWIDKPQRLFRTGSALTIDSNRYVSHYNNTELFDSNTDGYFEPFSSWQKAGFDTSGSCDTSKLADGEKQKLFYNHTKQTKIYDLGTTVFKDIYGKLMKDTFSLQPFTSKILIGKNLDQINQKPEINDQSFNISTPVLINDTIGQVKASDPDSDQTIRFSIIQGDDSDYFIIDSISGIIQIGIEILTEKNLSFEFLVKVTDDSPNSLSDTAKVTINITGIDISPPEITSFTIPSEAISFIVSITSFIATDNIGVSGYYLTENNSPVLYEDSLWLLTVPLNYTFSAEGSHILYAWAKDSAGNISISISDTVVITLPDLSPVYSEYLFEKVDSINVFDSNDSNHGIIMNNAISVNGATGKGISFSESGYINLGQIFGENVQEKITLSTWIKPTSKKEIYQGIITHRSFSGESFALYVNPHSKEIEFITNGTSNARLNILNIDELWDGNWHHLVVTYNGAEKVIYLDNVALIKEDAFGKIESGWKYNLYIGAGSENGFTSHLFDGLIDEVRIYNYALTPDEIGELYHTVNKEIKKIYTTEDISICEGEVYMVWSETGQYERILQRILPTASGADSIITTNLQITPNYFNTIEATICAGETYEFGNQSIMNSGEYTEIFKTIDGCDSIVVLNLTVNPKYYLTEEITISSSGSYLGLKEEGTYQRNFSTTSGCDSVIVTNLKVVPAISQFINLEKGWNIFSSYLIPDNENIESILVPISSEGKLTIVQDEDGNTFQKLSPQNWINNIGNLQKTEGYSIRVESPCILEIKGRQIELPMNIELKKGLNIISFPFNESIDAMQITRPLIDAGILEKIQDEKGRSIENWIGIGWINEIGNFIPGQGYIVFTNESGILSFQQPKEKSTLLIEENNHQTSYFKVLYEGNGYAHMNINVVQLNESQLNIGDEIAVFDNDICVGATKLTEKHMKLNFLSIPSSASVETFDNGFTDGSHVELRVWRNSNNISVKLLPNLIEGKLEFNKHASVFIEIKNTFDFSKSLQLYPNPANDIANIQFTVLPEEGVEIFLFDISGKKVMSRKILSNIEMLNIEHLPVGVYLLKVPVENEIITQKLVVI